MHIGNDKKTQQELVCIVRRGPPLLLAENTYNIFTKNDPSCLTYCGVKDIVMVFD